MELTTDVLVIGAGGAGMYAAIAAAREGAEVLIADKNMIGRGGATVMAQMTVAAALAEQEPDRVEDHLDDTLRASRGLADPDVAARLCADAPERMREMDRWGVGWDLGSDFDLHVRTGPVFEECRRAALRFPGDHRSWQVDRQGYGRGAEVTAERTGCLAAQWDVSRRRNCRADC